MKMKKWIAIPLVIALLSFGGTAMADDDHGKQNKNSDDEKVEVCKIPSGLANALKKEKNSKAKAAIEKNIEKYKQKCKDDENKKDDKDKNVWTDSQRVSADKAALKIGFGSNDSAQSVTGPIQLAATGKKGSIITWSSSKPNVITNNGLTVVRPTSIDETVVLTATITVNQATESKTFTLLVKALSVVVITDAQKVAADKAALQIIFNGTDTATSVTQALAALPSKGANGSTITWYSGSPSVISNDGKTVIRPSTGNGDVTVLMIAIVVSNAVSDAKIFPLTIKQQLTDNLIVAADKAALEINFGGSDTLTRVTRPVDQLPASGVNGSQITWTSGSTNIISNDGKTINRPAQGAGDATVLMTAIITRNSVSDVKVFTLTVKQDFTIVEKLAADKADLVITYGGSDLATQVTQPLSLPTTGYYGSTVIWISSTPTIISSNGTVINRPAHGAGDATVTLTAYISNSGIADLKTFQVIVKQLP
jgi:hypothetical protein